MSRAARAPRHGSRSAATFGTAGDGGARDPVAHECPGVLPFRVTGYRHPCTRALARLGARAVGNRFTPPGTDEDRA